MSLLENIQALRGEIGEGVQLEEIAKTLEVAEKLAIIGRVEDEASLKNILFLLIGYAEAVAEAEAEYIEDGAPFGVAECLHSIKEVIDKQ